MQQGRLLSTYTYNLPGGVQVNGTAMVAEGKEELEKIEQIILDTSANSSFIILNKR